MLEQHDPCYRSDLPLIREVEEQVPREKDLPFARWGECEFGFSEVAVPIIVHGHLVAVAFMGQCVRTAQQYADISQRLGQYAEREPGSELGAALATVHANGVDDSGRIEQRKRWLVDAVELIQAVAETRYRQWRERVENVFRDEIIGRVTLELNRRIEFTSDEREPLKRALAIVTRRMCEFWAFRRAHVFVQPADAALLELVASHPRDGSVPAGVTVEWGLPRAERCPASMYCPDGWTPQNEWQKRWAALRKALQKANLFRGRVAPEVLFVFIPLAERAMLFVFEERDESMLSPLPRHRIERVSELARDAITRTCRDTAERCREAWMQEDLQRSLRSLGHTLRAPLHIMRGPLGLLREELDQVPHADRERLRWLLDAGEQVVRAGELGADVARGEIDKFALGLALGPRLVKLNSKPVKLRETVEKLLRPFTFLGRPVGAGPGRTPPLFHWESDFDGLDVKGVLVDLELFKVAFFNLLDNAYKYSKKWSTISITCATTRTGDQNTVTVTNVGLPIDRDEINRVTEINYRGRHARKGVLERSEGTGLGLFMASEIAKAHGGELAVRCEPCLPRDPEGYMRITVTMSLPAVEEQSE